MSNHTRPAGLDRRMKPPCLCTLVSTTVLLRSSPTPLPKRATPPDSSRTPCLCVCTSVRAGCNIQAQVQGQGGQPIRAVHPPPQLAVPCPPQVVPVYPPIGTSPHPLISPLERIILSLTEKMICRCDARFFGGTGKPRECVLSVARSGYHSSCNV